MPDFSGPEYDLSDEDRGNLKDLGTWSLMATLYRMQIRYLMDQGNGSKNAESSSERIYVSPYEISHISKNYLELAEDEISRLSKELDREQTEDKNGKYALRVKSVPTINLIGDYAKILLDSCLESEKSLNDMNTIVAEVTKTLDLVLKEETENISDIPDENEPQPVWDVSSDTPIKNTGKNNAKDNYTKILTKIRNETDKKSNM